MIFRICVRLSDPKLREAGLAGNEPWDGPELILD